MHKFEHDLPFDPTLKNIKNSCSDRINPMDLVKSQDTDASKWATAFLQKFNETTECPKHDDVLAWFANAMMTMSDKTQGRFEKLLEEENRRCNFWEKRAYEHSANYDRSQKLLTEAHAIIGRSAHALSYRWDSMPLTVYMKDTASNNHNGEKTCTDSPVGKAL